ncbi:MAG TPA: hypothetical protein VF681_10580 [Abditibacteriaceae bacterium]|jgi:hypothetical protein
MRDRTNPIQVSLEQIEKQMQQENPLTSYSEAILFRPASGSAAIISSAEFVDRVLQSPNIYRRIFLKFRNDEIDLDFIDRVLYPVVPRIKGESVLAVGLAADDVEWVCGEHSGSISRRIQELWNWRVRYVSWLRKIQIGQEFQRGGCSIRPDVHDLLNGALDGELLQTRNPYFGQFINETGNLRKWTATAATYREPLCI